MLIYVVFKDYLFYDLDVFNVDEVIVENERKCLFRCV